MRWCFINNCSTIAYSSGVSWEFCQMIWTRKALRWSLSSVVGPAYSVRAARGVCFRLRASDCFFGFFDVHSRGIRFSCTGVFRKLVAVVSFSSHVVIFRENAGLSSELLVFACYIDFILAFLDFLHFFFFQVTTTSYIGSYEVWFWVFLLLMAWRV